MTAPLPGSGDGRARLAAARLVVVKVGSAVLAPAGELEPRAVWAIASDVARAAAGGRQFVIVSSGAIASGFRQLGLDSPPRDMALKQAAAAVGQQRLIQAWSRAFGQHKREVAQVLLTGDDFDHRSRALNARRTLETLLDCDVIPIINENDSVSFDEIKLGDNDRLSALVTGMLRADLLLMLSSVPGVLAACTADYVLSTVTPQEARAHLRHGKSEVGTGGMVTKLQAVEIAGYARAACVITGGGVRRVVSRVLAGEVLGTYFPPPPRGLSARKGWIGLAVRPRGRIEVDAGAQTALMERGASLLPAGVVCVRGAFRKGDCVDIAGPEGGVFARGLAAHAAADIEAMCGRRAPGKAGERDEVVHRNDMILLLDLA